MATPRAETVNPIERGTYHCWSRCVRRAYLCGFDSLTGKSFNHRKGWVECRMQALVRIFAIDVLAYALMDNHKHIVLRNYPDKALGWSANEVAYRWRQLFPKRRDEAGVGEEPSEAEITELMHDPQRIEGLRIRLCDISWFMRCLKEDIARRANEEDEVTGRFWEGRFKCSRLDDDAAILTGMVYVDLNPIRAGKAKSPEESEFTSAFTRLRVQQNSLGKTTSKSSEKKNNKQDLSDLKQEWLCPIESIFRRRSLLTLEEYLVILDETGRQVAKGKRGRIPPSLKPILERVSINSDNWLTTSRNFSRLFPRVAGSVQKMREAAEAAGRQWFKGLSAAASCF